MRRLIATGVAVTAMLVGGCTSGDDGAEEPTASPTTTSPSPTVELRPVVGERVPGAYHLSSAEVLGFGAAPEPDAEAINTVVEAVGDWLDAHLDSLQRDGAGRLDTMMPDAFQAAVGPEELAVVTTDLASPETPVSNARYQIDVFHDGAPQWASAKVDVTHPDGDVTSATMVFEVAEDGTPRLTFGGPETGGAQ